MEIQNLSGSANPYLGPPMGQTQASTRNDSGEKVVPPKRGSEELGLPEGAWWARSILPSLSTSLL